ncbi:major facilitator superfamily domain-containing protein [Aspergillus egyptiacus]|nr:major facilitator superfamily domain-containing protein [Aspergillus egyptiacus]
MTVPPQTNGNGCCRSFQQDVYKSRDNIPWKLEFRSSKGFVTSVVAIAIFTDVFIFGMIIPILPEVLKTRVSTPEDELQKWMSILLAAFGGALFISSPIFGYFADKSSSRQAPFLIGLLALGGSTVMFWFAHTLSALVVARLLQGISAAVVWTVGMALVVDTVGKEEVGASMGIVSMAMTVGTVSGPFIGGFMLSKAGYHAVFETAIGLIVLDIALRLVMIEKKTAAKWISSAATAEETERLIDPAAESQSGYENGNGTLHRNGSCSSNEGEGDAEPTIRSKRSAIPGIVHLLGSFSLLIVLVATFVEAAIYSSFDAVLPLYAMSTFNMTPLGIGLCFVPLFFPSFFSPLVGALVDRHGSRKISIAGFALALPVNLLLQLVKENTTADKITLYALLFCAGVGASLMTVSLMVEVSQIVEEKERECPGIFGKQGGTAQAYGLWNVAWSGGQVAGPLVAGWLAGKFGWGVMVSVMGGVSGITAAVLVLQSQGLARGFGVKDSRRY